MTTAMNLYIPVSVVMFLEFAIWGAWAPVLAARLLGPLKFSGKQTGWIYGTLPLAAIFAPLVAGQIADQWVSTEYLLAAAHLIGAVMMFVVVRQKKFAPLFISMLLYSCCYAATLPLVNKLVFVHIDGADYGWVFLWAPVSWALVGYALTGWRQIKGEGDSSDCLILAGILSAVMAVACLFAPSTPAVGKAGVAIFDAMSLLGDFNFLVFILVSLVVAGLMQFYFMGTARFMTDNGIAGKFVPGAMAIAQAAQAVATIFLMGLLIDKVGFQWTLVIGAACWLLMYLIYIAILPRAVIVASQALHGVAYVLFIIVGQIFANAFAPPSIRGSVQALVFAATTGIGLFVCTQAAGVVMDRFTVDGKFQWRKIWAVPAVLMALGVLVLAVGISDQVGLSKITAQIDADGNGQITRAELEKVPEAGVTSGAGGYSFSRAELLAAFDKTTEGDKPVAAGDLAKALEEAATAQAKKSAEKPDDSDKNKSKAPKKPDRPKAPGIG